MTISSATLDGPIPVASATPQPGPAPLPPTEERLPTPLVAPGQASEPRPLPAADWQAFRDGRPSPAPLPGQGAPDTLDSLPAPRVGPGAYESWADIPASRRELSPAYRYPGSGPVKVAFFDADGTLRGTKSGKAFAENTEDYRVLPNVGDRLAELARQGYLIAIVSNQAGVEAGHLTLEQAEHDMNHSVHLIAGEGGVVHWYDYAEVSDDNRKPNLGMARRLDQFVRHCFGEQAAIDWSASFMVGDASWKKGEARPDGTPGTDFSNSDRRFAENAGLTYHDARAYFGW